MYNLCMAHIRKRFLTENIIQSLGFSSIIGILGHRQVGKTTLLNGLVKDYVTLDLKEKREFAQNKPDEFLATLTKKPVGIDECQLAPDLFPALKEAVRINKKPGQFIITGSVRFTSRKAIRESLTGRIINHELLPFTISELIEDGFNFLAYRLHNYDFESHLPQSPKRILNLREKHGLTYLKNGGLPGVCFVRNEVNRNTRIESQLETILDRDLTLLIHTRLRLNQLKNMLSELAKQQGSPVHFGKLAKAAETTIPTVKSILQNLESLFLIRRLPSEGSTKSEIYFFEDLGESYYLNPKGHHHQTLAALQLLVFAHLKAAMMYQRQYSSRFYHFLNRGSKTPMICVEANQANTAFFSIMGSIPTRSEAMQANSYLSAMSNSKVVFVTWDHQSKALDRKRIIVSIWELV